MIENKIINVVNVQSEKDLTHPEWEFIVFFQAKESH